MLSKKQLELISLAIGEFSGNYAEVREQAAAVERAFRAELARQFQPHFTSFVGSLPRETIEEKQELAKVVNYEMNRLGLALRVPKTGECAFLGADTAGNPNKGEFHFGVRRGEKNTKSRCGEDLPKLELMANDGSRDTKVDWFTKVEASMRPHVRGRRR